MPKTKKPFERRKDTFTLYFEPAESRQPGLKRKQLEALADTFAETMRAKFGATFKTSVAGFVISLIETYGETFAKEGLKPKETSTK